MPLPTTRPLPLDTSDRGTLEDIAHVLLEHPGTLVLTGAGMSTASGIPDYRGPDGTRRVEPMTYAMFTSGTPARQRYWARSFVGWPRFRRARPNTGHAAVTALQGLGLVGAVVTQNVDGLHQASGSRDVVDLHGRLSVVRCLGCGATSDRDVLQERMAALNPGIARLAGPTDPHEPTGADGPGDSERPGAAGRGSQWGEVRPDGDVDVDEQWVCRFVLPRCLVCGSDSLKPDVVYFGESVPRERVARCTALTDAAPALLVLGSSLSVMSGLRFVRRASRNGVPVAIITLSGTRGDEHAPLRVHAPLVDALPRLVDLAAAHGP